MDNTTIITLIVVAVVVYFLWGNIVENYDYTAMTYHAPFQRKTEGPPFNYLTGARNYRPCSYLKTPDCSRQWSPWWGPHKYTNCKNEVPLAKLWSTNDLDSREFRNKLHSDNPIYTW